MNKDGSNFESLSQCGKPLWLVAELTYKCPLKCSWCSNPIDFEDYTDELSTSEWIRVFHEARKLGSLQLGFSGGEPLVRKDLEILVDEANKMGFYTNLITSGMGMTEERLIRLKQNGLKQIQLSFQHSNAAMNDAMVGAKSFDQKLQTIKMIKRYKFPMVLNVPITRLNIDDVEEMVELAVEHEVEFIELANIQYYAWAYLNRDGLLPTYEELKTAEEKVDRLKEKYKGKTKIFFVIPDYFDGRPKACMNGWGSVHLSIAPDGSALPCHEAKIIPGIEYPSVKKHRLEWIWNESEAFNAFRGEDWMKEPCTTCDERKKDFGGCRCQAYMMTGDAKNTDPACSKSQHFSMMASAIESAKNREGFQKPLVMRAKGAVSTQFMKV